MNAAAVSDAHKNAENNGIKNCRFICSKVRSAVLIFLILVEFILYLAHVKIFNLLYVFSLVLKTVTFAI
jgi:hypothetical protein